MMLYIVVLQKAVFLSLNMMRRGDLDRFAKGLLESASLSSKQKVLIPRGSAVWIICMYLGMHALRPSARAICRLSANCECISSIHLFDRFPVYFDKLETHNSLDLSRCVTTFSDNAQHFSSILHVVTVCLSHHFWAIFAPMGHFSNKMQSPTMSFQQGSRYY